MGLLAYSDKFLSKNSKTSLETLDFKAAQECAMIEECLQFAEECLRWADQAETEEQRKTYLALARTWTIAALRLQGVMIPQTEDWLFPDDIVD
jgi:hypothetical protein